MIESLEVEFGNGERLLGTEGPPAGFARMITPEQAAEILGIDLVLLERRVRAGRLVRYEVHGKATFSLAEVMARKEYEDKQRALMIEINEDMEGVGSPAAPPRKL